jgi:hypothetical protein
MLLTDFVLARRYLPQNSYSTNWGFTTDSADVSTKATEEAAGNVAFNGYNFAISLTTSGTSAGN